MNPAATLHNITVATMKGIYELTPEVHKEYFRHMRNGGDPDVVLCHLGVPLLKPLDTPFTFTGEIPSTYDTRAAEALLAQTKKAATERQVGGTHYKGLWMQPGTFSHNNGLKFYEGCVIKRVCRHSRGGDGRQDIEKAIHELQIILELEYGDDSAT